MKKNTLIRSSSDPGALEQARELILEGGVIAFPTDTVYGIGASAFNQEAIDNLYQIKERSHLKAIPVLISDLDQLDQVTTKLNPAAARIIHRFWPGALTLVLPLHPRLPDNLSESDTIGVRLPDHELARALLRATGPLAATSANLSGQPSALTAADVLAQLEGRIDLLLDGGPAPGGQASTVLDCSGDQLRILREGPISWDAVQEALDD